MTDKRRILRLEDLFTVEKNNRFSCFKNYFHFYLKVKFHLVSTDLTRLSTGEKKTKPKPHTKPYFSRLPPKQKNKAKQNKLKKKNPHTSNLRLKPPISSLKIELKNDPTLDIVGSLPVFFMLFPQARSN